MIQYYTPTPTQVSNMGRIALDSRCNKLIYKKIDTNYLAYHTCGKQGVIDQKTLAQAKANHICPFCYRPIQSTTTETHQSGYQFIGMRMNDDEVFGYYVIYEYELGKELLADCEQVYYASGDICYHRYIGFDLFAHYLSLNMKRIDWHINKRKRMSYSYGYERHPYEDCLCNYQRYLESLNGTKKEYLKKNVSFITKSNQKKLAMDNILSLEQLMFIKVFDLKSLDELKKYKKYIKENSIHVKDLLHDNIILNSYYLDYLNRNNISLGQYYHFIKDLSLLKFKFEKPTDFKHRAEVIHGMAKDAKDKEMDVNISLRCKELPVYSNGDVSIKPFSSADEIRRCGKELHNCIGGYVDNYATKKTDIYHLDLDGALKIAIEIKSNKLLQAYADHNKPCPAELMKHIKSFCNSNGFSLGNYA